MGVGWVGTSINSQSPYCYLLGANNNDHISIHAHLIINNLLADNHLIVLVSARFCPEKMLILSFYQVKYFTVFLRVR